MCYMTGRRSIGVRELRQNASRYLRHVEAGETLEVTSRGRPVALLTPLPERASVRDRLIAEGKLIPARRRLADLGPPPRVRVSRSVSRALEEEREERLP
jgi:prevent-host-death family protein